MRLLLVGLLLSVLAVGLQLVLAERAPAAAGVGPKRSIKCPPQAVRVGPAGRIQRAINRHPPGTVFCIRKGIHRLRGPITPKTGNRFIGQFGAIIDGSRWRTNDPNQGLFRAHNQNIDHVVIRNLVIRNSPQRGIHAYKDHSDRWIIENNRISGNRVGIAHGNHFQIRRNVIRGNWQLGISSFRSRGSVIARNRLAFNAARFRDFPGNSAATKWAVVTNTVVRGNWFLDNHSTGIWFDGRHRGIVIARNTVRRNGANGILTEVGGATLIQDNVVTGHHRGIYISDSRDTTVTGNILTNNDRAIWLFQDGNRRGESELGNNLITGNRIWVPARSVVSGVTPLAAGLNCIALTTAECSDYLVNHGNAYQGNAYVAPSSSGRYWGVAMIPKTWSEWRAAGQDTTGTLRIG
jgi:parallel beta-helix repeat protein